jgi:hypothetical protein
MKKISKKYSFAKYLSLKSLDFSIKANSKGGLRNRIF